MTLIIDRFTEGYARCEQGDGTFVDILREALPAGAKAGDVLHLVDGVYIIDQEETEARRRYAIELTRSLLAKDREED